MKNGADLISSVRRENGVVFAAVRGEIDLHNTPELREALLDDLLDGNPRKVVFDLAQVPYMDSSAIAVFVEGMQRMRRYGGKICLSHLQPRVRGLLEIARLDTIFTILKDDQQPLAK